MICLLGSLIFKFIIFIDFFFLSDHDYCYFRAILILYDINCFYFAKGQHFCISGNLRSKCCFQCFSCFVLHVVWHGTKGGYRDVQGEWEFSEREAQIVVGPALHLTFQKSETTASNFSLSLVDTGGRRASALIPGVGLQRLEPERSLKEGRRPFLPLIVQLVAFSWLTLFTFRSCLFSPHLAIKV